VYVYLLQSPQAVFLVHSVIEEIAEMKG
jgi:hypothetical protein